ncbi:hypothetical protein DEU56DRAFT_793672 [Suillus clintonianus]|uniref:uncharacterized protein n=1 Tax=Suillus clintonianus TaxID=1904413 RepID=UPI001B875F39|nr:uncharacterized protein DEU56DRAFT_793672 [Suillus clintonianus]KAG2142344.1 hypothetical protein DEU56DRAFT_793672 [Suillus clintonianus]
MDMERWILCRRWDRSFYDLTWLINVALALNLTRALLRCLPQLGMVQRMHGSCVRQTMALGVNGTQKGTVQTQLLILN